MNSDLVPSAQNLVYVAFNSNSRLSADTVTSSNRPLFILMLLLLVFQSVAASAMDHESAVQPIDPVSSMGEMGAHHPSAEPGASLEEHQTNQDHHRNQHHDHAAGSGDCCDGDSACSLGHCSASIALAQLHFSASPWTAIQRSLLAISQVQAPVYSLFRPPISA